ncbi:MAG: four helix bundle protein [Flavobacteriaceae bacterium]
MATYNTFRELDCWEKCRILRKWIDTLVKTERLYRDFDMSQNLIRAARSTTRNIAEGFGRFHFKENIQYCRISRGSLFEIEDDLITCFDEKKINRSQLNEGLQLLKMAVYSLNGYIKYLKHSASR